MLGQKILVAYYSGSGHTTATADEIAAELGATVERIFCPGLDGRPLTFMRQLASALFRTRPPIAPIAETPQSFDLLVLGAPVWAGRLATPALSYLTTVQGRLPPVALFLSAAGAGTGGAVDQVSQIIGHPPVAVVSITNGDRTSGDQIGKIQDFVDRIRTWLTSETDIRINSMHGR
ncbi:MAG: hypothetical protein AAGF59_02545 [Pseudomonadota bacterium]